LLLHETLSIAYQSVVVQRDSLFWQIEIAARGLAGVSLTFTDETASAHLVSPFTTRHNHAHFRPAIGFIPSATADFFSL